NAELAGVKKASLLAMAWQVRPDCLSPSAPSSTTPPARLPLHWPPLWTRNTATVWISPGFGAATPQHDPPQQPQGVRSASRPGNREEGAVPGGHSDAALYPEMLGRRRTQAGVIIRTDSQRNVSRGNRVGWAIFAAKLSTRFLKFFGTP